MLFTDMVFVGIDAASSHKSYTYAALDKGMNLIALADGELDDVTTFLGGQSSAIVAINAPSGVNRGLVREKKKDMFKSVKPRAAGFRVAELELRDRGITVSGTPSTISACSAWVQSGFALYRKLEKMGFKKYPTENTPYQILESQPHAAFCVMAEAIPQPKPSLEGKIQRQLLLYEAGVRIKDPMDFFEEITRHKMLKGNWPLDMLYQPEQLDALVAAYTAWLSIHKPEKVSLIGDSTEGQIAFPEKNLKEKY